MIRGLQPKADEEAVAECLNRNGERSWNKRLSKLCGFMETVHLSNQSMYLCTYQSTFLSIHPSIYIVIIMGQYNNYWVTGDSSTFSGNHQWSRLCYFTSCKSKPFQAALGCISLILSYIWLVVDLPPRKI